MMRNILKYPGSKWKIAPWIISRFPAGYERMNYLEPFFGSGAVFFTKARSRIETVNDIDSNVVNLFRTARDRPEELARAVSLTPWAREEYEQSYVDAGDMGDVERARRFLVRMWQGHGSKSKTSTGWRKYVTGRVGGARRFHSDLPESVIAVCERFKHAPCNHVQIEHKDAFELLGQHSTADTLIYADPPYVMSARSGKLYKHEFSDGDHVRLLELLKAHPGPVALSGYASGMYDSALAGWHRHETEAQTESARKKTEVLWTNYDPQGQCVMAGF